MATKKFSEFTPASSGADDDYVVGLKANDNAKFTLLTVWNYIKSKADAIYAAVSHTHSNYTPYASNTHTIPANTEKWIRIAKSAIHVGKNAGQFNILFSVSGSHEYKTILISNIYNRKKAISLTYIHNSKYEISNSNIKRVRVVYKENTYTNEYCYIELLVKNTNTTDAATVSVHGIDLIGLSLTVADGAIPTGYTAEELSLISDYPNYSLSDKMAEIYPVSGVYTIDCREKHNNAYFTLTANAGIVINYIPDGYEGTITISAGGAYGIAYINCYDENGIVLTELIEEKIYQALTGEWNYLLRYKRVGGSVLFSMSDRMSNL
jgi:hypothetical protein